MNEQPAIVVAGGAGFVGRACIPLLLEKFRVIALSRGSAPQDKDEAGVEWRQCDLFSLRQTRAALEGATLGLYLVHSMLPSSQLTQAHFRDLDFLAADNFARAANEQGITHIVYVGGIVPQHGALSPHLESRLEVESVLSAYGATVVSLRAAMIIGKGSSSLSIVRKLAHRLPVMLCPAWTRNRSSPVSIDDLAEVVSYYFNNLQTENKSIDVGGSSELSYKEVIQGVAAQIGKAPLIFTVPVKSPKLSRLWIELISGAPANLVGPLVDSLQHSLTLRPDHLPDSPDYAPKDFETMVAESLQADKEREVTPHAFRVPQDEWRHQTARSVQRLPLPAGWDANSTTSAYIDWLPKFLWPIFETRVLDDGCDFHFWGIRSPLLSLRKIEQSSHDKRAVFSIAGGLLADTPQEGTLEFRETHDGEQIVAAIHNFKPRLPWYIYRVTQAIFHQLVMWRFGAFLGRKKRQNASGTTPAQSAS